MTEEQRKKCHAIIHSCAAADGAGNLFPVPGTGFAADVVALTTMAMSLSAVFGKDMTKSVAKATAIAALKKATLKNPMKTLTKEASKLMPFGGQAVSCTISVAMAEAAGWSIAYDLDNDKL